jgi:hypothetical protein
MKSRLSSGAASTFVTPAPEVLEEGHLYVSMPYATAIHLCACGCRSEVVTPLRPGQWRLIFDGRVSLRPSIGNWSYPCRSHYFIDRDRVGWARPWTEGDAGAGRFRRRQRSLVRTLAGWLRRLSADQH